MEIIDQTQAVLATSLKDWRDWLGVNAEKERFVWLIVYHKSSAVASGHWHDAIEHALCYGWVDSKAKGRDKESCFLIFTPRNPKSKWENATENGH